MHQLLQLVRSVATSAAQRVVPIRLPALALCAAFFVLLTRRRRNMLAKEREEAAATNDAQSRRERAEQEYYRLKAKALQNEASYKLLSSPRPP